MDAESKQKIIHGHGHLISSSKPPGSCNAPEAGSKEETGPPTPAPGIVINFGHVAPGIYRSSFPQAENFEHLASLKLRSILWDPSNIYLASSKLKPAQNSRNGALPA